jgi:hypothetical protein
MAADGSLHERIVAYPVVVYGVLISAGDRHGSGHHLEHLVQDAVRITATRHRGSEQAAHAELALGLPQQQQSRVGGLIAANKSTVSFLRRTAGSSKGSGVSMFMTAVRLDNDCLCESRLSRHCRHSKLTAGE